MVEAGYSEPAPRSYTVTERTSLFSMRYNNTYEGYEVYQYDGKAMPEKLVVPKTYNNKPVVSVGNKFISNERGVREVVLPETIRHIGSNAFADCSGLEKINIPDAVESVDRFAFTGCSKLSDVTANGRVTYRNNAFILDNTVLLSVPCASQYSVPAGIKEIAEYAFSYNSELGSVTLAPTVTSIGAGAFYNCPSLSELVVQGNNLTSIGAYAFASSAVTEVYFPKSLTDISDYAAEGVTALTVYGYKGSAAETFAASKDNVTFSELSDMLTGDVDGDGKLTVQDVTTLQRFLAEMQTLSVPAHVMSDVNSDGVINIRDVTALQRAVAS